MANLTATEVELAWQHVAENAGCAGVDGVTVEHYARHGSGGFEQLAEEAGSDTYRCLPLLKITVEKSGGGRRDLLIPAVRDRILQTAVARRLSKSFEAVASTGRLPASYNGASVAASSRQRRTSVRFSTR